MALLHVISSLLSIFETQAIEVLSLCQNGCSIAFTILNFHLSIVVSKVLSLLLLRQED